jgi:hypothetical protein
LPRIAALAEPRLKLIRRGHDLSGREPRLRTRITVDEVRALAGFFGLSAADGGRRVVIVDAADDMTPNAANAVLKLLEEPPRGAVLLLVAHQLSRLLPTIRSRCRVLPCAPLDAAGLAAALDQAGCGDGAAPDALAALAGGSAGRAVALAMEGGAEAYASLVTLMSGAPGLDRAALAELAAACAGREAQPRFDLTLDLIDLLLHRLARTGAAGPPAPEAAPGEAAMLARLSPGLRAARVWAETTAATERARRGAAVNLDPAGLILDTGVGARPGRRPRRRPLTKAQVPWPRSPASPTAIAIWIFRSFGRNCPISLIARGRPASIAWSPSAPRSGRSRQSAPSPRHMTACSTPPAPIRCARPRIRWRRSSSWSPSPRIQRWSASARPGSTITTPPKAPPPSRKACASTSRRRARPACR